MAMVLTRQKPRQRDRFFGEISEDLPGSTKSVGGVEEKRQELGRPVGFRLRESRGARRVRSYGRPCSASPSGVGRIAIDGSASCASS